MASLIRTPLSLSPSTAWLQKRAQITRGLVDVLVRPSGCGYVCRTREHNQVTVEALLQDEAGTGDVWPECDDDDRPPPVLLRETTQFLCFALGGGWIWDEAMQLEIWVRSATEVRVRQHDGRCPSLGFEVEAEVVACVSVSSEDEYRIGTAQLVDLWPYIDGQSADDGYGPQHTRRYRQSSDAPPSRGSPRLTSDAG